MKLRSTTGLLALAAACSTASYVPPSNDAVRDYIVTNELAEQDRIRTFGQDGWVIVNNRFIIYKGRFQDYLMEFRRECKEMREPVIVANLRRDDRNLRPRFDTMAGCTIETIYAINKGESIELKALGEARGDRN